MGVGVYLGVSSASFLTFLGVFASGLVDTSVVVDAIHTYTPVERWTGYDLRQLDPIWGNLTLAKVANVVIEPLRLLVAVSLTPRIGRWWRNERYERKQAKQEADELQNNEEPDQDEPLSRKTNETNKYHNFQSISKDLIAISDQFLQFGSQKYARASD